MTRKKKTGSGHRRKYLERGSVPTTHTQSDRDVMGKEWEEGEEGDLSKYWRGKEVSSLNNKLSFVAID